MGLKKISQMVINRLPLGYYNGSLYKMVIGAQGQTKFEPAADNFKPWILIVSREFYQESLDHLAITNQREVKALLKLNNADAQTNNVYCVNTVTENQTFFNSWKFTKDLGSALFTLPEGLLLASELAENCAVAIESDQYKPRLYVASSKQGIYSSKPTAVISNLSRFCQSCGLSEQLTTSTLTAAQLPKALLKGLRNLSANQWLSFWRPPINTLSYNNFKVPLLLGLGCTVFYLVLSSGYLYWQNEQLEQKIQAGRAEVTEALNVQDEFTAMQAQVEGLSAVAGEFKTKAMIWQILLPLYKEAEFDNVRYQDGRFILRGRTAKATELLAKLAANQGVVDAHFDLPVTTNRSRENFTISFRWQAAALITEEEASDATTT